MQPVVFLQISYTHSQCVVLGNFFIHAATYKPQSGSLGITSMAPLHPTP